MLESQNATRTSPIDGSITWRGAYASHETIDAAIQRAHTAFQEWSLQSIERRFEMALAYAAFLEKNASEIAKSITFESGKPRWESIEEVQSAISKVTLSIKAIRERRWIANESQSELERSYAVRYRPLGVMLVLGPYNLPLHLPGAHIVPSLLAGNTVVFKPSEKTPAVGDWIAKAWQAAGLPAGVLGLFHGSVEQAKYAVASPQIGGVLFTGSYRAGVEIHRQLAGRPEVMLALEMGGNNPIIVDRVQEREAAIMTLIQSAFITSGQRCTCARRIIIIDHPENRGLIEDLSRAIQRIRVSLPHSDPQPFMGTLVSEQAAQAILSAQTEWIRRGARVWNRSEVHPSSPALLSPGLLQIDGLNIGDEEHFGPLATVHRAVHLNDAIAQANQTRYGLAASLLSDDEDAFRCFSEHIRAGIVNWNAPSTGATGSMPFGGVGASGNHRPSGYFACDYTSDPVASIQKPRLTKPDKLPTGLEDL
jgi:succinylglutamic semialdehyde dehydrogenase